MESSGRNAFEADSRRGIRTLVSFRWNTVGHRRRELRTKERETDPRWPLTGADFQIDVTGEQRHGVPMSAGHRSVQEYELARMRRSG